MNDLNDAIATLERDLRGLIIAVTNDTWTQLKGAPELERLEDKQREDNRRRDGAVVTENLLSYAELYHVTGMILKNWEHFSEIFGDKRRTEIFLKIIEDYRNPTAHSRSLLNFERQLLVGASGQLRNQISLWRSSKFPARVYYPEMEEVFDQFGNQYGIEDWYSVERDAPPRISVGDILTVTCRAWDPRGQTLHWYVLVWPGEGDGHAVVEADSIAAAGATSECSLDFQITEDFVAEEFRLAVIMQAPDARYHRRRTAYDGRANMVYAVNPPGPVLVRNAFA